MKLRWAVLTVGAALCSVLAVLQLTESDDASQPPLGSAASASAAEILLRGEYLARAGNCMHCHTARGGAAYAGGRAIETPYGLVYTSNLTPDASTGIGKWSADDFWHALHQGRSKDGRWLLPAFPYTNFTRVSRADSDALFAYLRSVPAVSQPNLAHALAWPFNAQWALGIWRGLFFRVQPFVPDSTQSAQWNRGAYLVQGLGHCSACHAPRNFLGASSDAAALAGGMIAMQNWYAPSLAAGSEAGGNAWTTQELAQVLQTGASAHGGALGPMADVVLNSTQYLTIDDLNAMALYLKGLPSNHTGTASMAHQADTLVTPSGAKLYKEHCAPCHSEDGRGVPGAYPALLGSAAVNLASPVNLVQVVLNGGFAPATAGNPRPFGMPPYALSLSDHDIAAVLTYVRSAWGNRAAEVTPQEVDRLRSHTR